MTLSLLVEENTVKIIYHEIIKTVDKESKDLKF